VCVPAAELHGRDVRPSVLTKNFRSGLHERGDAAASHTAASHRFFANQILLLHRSLKAAVQDFVCAIQSRQAIQIRVVYSAELGRRPRLYVVRSGKRARHA
jgi:hypothetical protein